MSWWQRWCDSDASPGFCLFVLLVCTALGGLLLLGESGPVGEAILSVVFFVGLVLFVLVVVVLARNERRKFR